MRLLIVTIRITAARAIISIIKKTPKNINIPVLAGREIKLPEAALSYVP